MLSGGDKGVALIVGGKDGKGEAVLDTEVYDFAQGKYMQGPKLERGRWLPRLVWVGTTIFVISGTAFGDDDAEEVKEVLKLKEDAILPANITLTGFREGSVVIAVDRHVFRTDDVCKESDSAL